VLIDLQSCQSSGSLYPDQKNRPSPTFAHHRKNQIGTPISLAQLAVGHHLQLFTEVEVAQ
jgi:hypothetical protein